VSEDFFIKLTKTLAFEEDWLNARPTHQSIFIAILLRMAFAETVQDYKGHKVKIKPCQLYVSQEKLANWSSSWLSKDDVEGALKYFSRCKFLLHEVLHKKSLITITHRTICKQFLNSIPPKNPRQLLHDSSIKEELEELEELELKEKNIKKEKIESIEEFMQENKEPSRENLEITSDNIRYNSDNQELTHQRGSQKKKKSQKKTREIISDEIVEFVHKDLLDEDRENGRILLKKKELEKLQAGHDTEKIKKKINKLSLKLAEEPGKYTNHYRTLLNWLEDDFDYKPSQTPPNIFQSKIRPKESEIRPFPNNNPNQNQSNEEMKPTSGKTGNEPKFAPNPKKVLSG
jgi:hypothetical protein